MKKTFLVAVSLVLLITFVFTGCKSKPASADNSNVDTSETAKLEDPIFSDEIPLQESVTPYANKGTGGTAEKTFGRVAILGDSYSTFKGMMKKSTYVCWYNGKSDDEWGITAADITWWGKLILDTDSEFVCNSSYSGAAVSRMRYGKYEVESSFVERLKNDIDFDKIDTLFIFGCTNDSWGNSPLGELKYSGFTDDDLKCTIPSYCYMLDYIKTKAPKVRVINIMNCSLKSEIYTNIEACCKHYGYEYVRLSDELDKEKLQGHPTAAGMRMIADQVKALLK